MTTKVSGQDKIREVALRHAKANGHHFGVVASELVGGAEENTAEKERSDS